MPTLTAIPTNTTARNIHLVLFEKICQMYAKINAIILKVPMITSKGYHLTCVPNATMTKANKPAKKLAIRTKHVRRSLIEVFILIHDLSEFILTYKAENMVQCFINFANIHATSLSKVGFAATASACDCAYITHDIPAMRAFFNGIGSCSYNEF